MLHYVDEIAELEKVCTIVVDGTAMTSIVFAQSVNLCFTK